MPFRAVIRAKKLGGRLAGHSRQNARRVAKSATDQYRDRLPPDREFLDLYEHQTAIGEELDQMRAELIAIDDRHAHQQHRNRKLRLQRDSRATEMRQALVKVKDTLDGSCGPGASREVFHEEPPVLPDDPVALHQIGQRVYDTMTATGFELEPAQPGVVVNPRVLADGFEGPLHDLGEALERLHDGEGEARHTQSQKDVLHQRLRIKNGKAARYFEALADLAGHEGLAKRLRQSRHGRRDDGEPEAGPAPANDGEPAAPAATADGVTDDEATPDNTA